LQQHEQITASSTSGQAPAHVRDCPEISAPAIPSVQQGSTLITLWTLDG
jgi:hypothetical protein